MGNTEIPKTRCKPLETIAVFSFLLSFLLLSRSSSFPEKCLGAGSKLSPLQDAWRSLPPAARHLNGRDERNCHFFLVGKRNGRRNELFPSLAAPNGDLWHDRLIEEEERNIVHPPGGARGQRKKKEERLNFVPSFPSREKVSFVLPPSLKGNPNHPMNERTTALVTSRVTLL